MRGVGGHLLFSIAVFLFCHIYSCVVIVFVVAFGHSQRSQLGLVIC